MRVSDCPWISYRIRNLTMAAYSPRESSAAAKSTIHVYLVVSHNLSAQSNQTREVVFIRAVLDLQKSYFSNW